MNKLGWNVQVPMKKYIWVLTLMPDHERSKFYPMERKTTEKSATQFLVENLSKFFLSTDPLFCLTFLSIKRKSSFDFFWNMWPFITFSFESIKCYHEIENCEIWRTMSFQNNHRYYKKSESFLIFLKF